MRKIHSFRTRFCQWVLGLLGVRAAVSSCDKIENVFDFKCYYGCPTMSCEVKG